MPIAVSSSAMPAKIESSKRVEARPGQRARDVFVEDADTASAEWSRRCAASSLRTAEVSAPGFETLVRTTSDMMLNGICVCGRYISGESSFFSERCFTLPTTPTISRIFSPVSSARQTGHDPFADRHSDRGKICSRSARSRSRPAWIRTGRVSSKTRPCRSGMPIVLK